MYRETYEGDDDMKKGFLLLTLIAMLAVALVGCGSKGEEDVVADLTTKLENVKSYKMNANLVLQTGQEAQEYEVEVSHQKPQFYRIALKNKARDITQIILRNEEGVFVLTPHLNKSFRFQSGWPENHGQVYLYESLIKDILADDNRVFSTEGDQYVFETAANYQNKTLVSQKIFLDKDLKPTKVDVMDADMKVIVGVEFSNVEFDASFEKDYFDMKRNMQQATLESITTMKEESEKQQGSFGVYHPTYTPENVKQVEVKEVQQDGHPVVVLRYEGDYNYNIVQERPRAKMVTMTSGKPVDLGFTVGVMTERSLLWTYDGVDFKLTGDGLPEAEMVNIAQSVVGQSSK